MTPRMLRCTAGENAVLAARPSGVLHAYQGPLTPSGRFIPRAGQTVCRARTRRLAVVDLEAAFTVATPAGDRQSGLPRVCARCSACLSRKGSRGRRAEPTTRVGVLATYGGMSLTAIASDLEAATSETEVDQLAHLALAVHGIAACARSLQELVSRHRGRVHVLAEHEKTRREDWDLALVNAHEQRRAERHAVWQDREDRIARIGINNVQPTPRAGKPTK